MQTIGFRVTCWFLVLGALALAEVNPGLQQVHAVYILGMGSGMDQFLANRLGRMGGVQVVADPNAADTILTDRLGEAFEKKLDEIYAPPKEEDEETADVRKPETSQLRPSSFGRGKGTYFLVDRKSRNVVWSVYARPKNGRPDEFDRMAGRIVERLKNDLKPAKN